MKTVSSDTVLCLVEFCIRSSPTLYKYVNVIAEKPRIKLIITVCYLYLPGIHKQGAVSVKRSSLYKIKNVHASLVWPDRSNSLFAVFRQIWSVAHLYHWRIPALVYTSTRNRRHVCCRGEEPSWTLCHDLWIRYSEMLGASQHKCPLSFWAITVNSLFYAST